MYMMMNVIVLSLMFLQYASCQYSDDIFARLFGRPYTQENFNYLDYNSDCGCWSSYPCQVDDNDYISNDDSNVGVVYVNPEQLNNIYNFIKNRIDSRTTTEKNYEDSTEVTPQKTSENIATTTEVQNIPTSPASEETTTLKINEENDDDDPVEDIPNFWSERTHSNERATLPSTGDSSTDNPNEEENEPTEKTESAEYNNEYQMRDSAEERLSLKKNEEDTKNKDEDLEEYNDSKPDNVLSWLN